MLGLDFETSGPEPDWARVVTYAAVHLTPPGAPAGARAVVVPTTRLADPGVVIPAGAAAVHGISTERARAEGFPARDVVFEVLEMVRAAFTARIPVVGHNVSFDLTVLDREARRHGFAPLDPVVSVLDTLVLDRALVHRSGKRRLTDCAAYHGVPLSAEDAHDALADTLASLRILWKLTRAFPDLADTPLEDLHALQVELAASQTAALEKQLRRWKGRNFTIDRAWPVTPLPDGWDPAYHPDER